MGEPKRYDLEKLRELSARLEASRAIDRPLNGALHDFFGFTHEDHCRGWCHENGRTDLTRAHYLAAWAKSFTSSRDAAHALFERVLPECSCLEGRGQIRPDEPMFGAVVYADLTPSRELGVAEGDVPARVLCLAILRALIASEEARG
jgi:hypothetical protein